MHNLNPQNQCNAMHQYSKLYRVKDWTLKLMRNTEYHQRDFESRNLAISRTVLHTMNS